MLGTPLATLMTDPLAAMRPVFLILMGLSLLLVAWRLTRRSGGWSGRFLMAGAILLAVGYALVLPLYEARLLVPISMITYYPNADAGTALGWHLLKVVSMNGGWLLFGTGLAIMAHGPSPLRRNPELSIVRP